MVPSHGLYIGPITLVMLAGSYALLGNAYGHGPAPAPLQVLTRSGQFPGGFFGDNVRPDLVRTSIGLAASNPDGSYTYRCPSELGGRETALAAATPSRSLLVTIGGGQVYASVDGGCSGQQLTLPDGDTDYPSELVAWRGAVWFITRGDAGGRLYRVDATGELSSAHEFHGATPDSLMPFQLDTGQGGLLVTAARPTPTVWLGTSDVSSSYDVITWRDLPDLPLVEGLQRLDPKALSDSGDSLWVLATTAAGRSLWLGQTELDSLVTVNPQWSKGDGAWGLVHGPIWAHGSWLASLDGRAAVVPKGTLDPVNGWVTAGIVTWTCLQRLEDTPYACTLAGMNEITDIDAAGTSDMTVGLRPVWGIQQLDAPDTSCLDESARLACTQDWLHFGGESGLVGRPPKTDPTEPLEPYFPQSGGATEGTPELERPNDASDHGGTETGCAAGTYPSAAMTLLALLFGFLGAWTGCGGQKAPLKDSPAPVDIGAIAPEKATGFRAVKPLSGSRFMVTAANSHASRVGAQIIEAGGSAIDAAVAMQAVLNLVEPQSSGIGGGAFILYHDRQTGKLKTYDGRETAPASLDADAFRTPSGKPMSFPEAVFSARSVGVPGVLRALEMAHRDHGKLPWKDLFEPAVKLARDGFKISPRLHALVSADPLLKKREAQTGRRYFTAPDGSALPVGHRLINEPLANTLSAIASKGADWFYQDAYPLLGAEMEAHGGALSASDLRNYKAKRRAPVCLKYRARWKVCGMGPPTSGGITTLQILGMLERFDLSTIRADSAQFAHLFAEASKRAYADRGAYIGDPDVLAVPVSRLLDRAYLARRAAQIDPSRASGKSSAGTFPARGAAVPPQDESIETPSTSHLSVIDRDGDAVAMTTTIESAFGSRIMTKGGFLLNNEMTDFTWYGDRAELASHPNAIAPGKRPRSSMAPTIVYDNSGRVRLVVGSPGGSRIINYVARVLLLVLDYGLDPQSAIAAPNLANRNGVTELERYPSRAAWTARVRGELEAMGHQVIVREMTSGLHAVAVRRNGTLLGGADPRREGVPVGR